MPDPNAIGNALMKLLQGSSNQAQDWGSSVLGGVLETPGVLGGLMNKPNMPVGMQMLGRVGQGVDKFIRGSETGGGLIEAKERAVEKNPAYEFAGGLYTGSMRGRKLVDQMKNLRAKAHQVRRMRGGNQQILHQANLDLMDELDGNVVKVVKDKATGEVLGYPAPFGPFVVKDLPNIHHGNIVEEILKKKGGGKYKPSQDEVINSMIGPNRKYERGFVSKDSFQEGKPELLDEDFLEWGFFNSLMDDLYR